MWIDPPIIGRFARRANHLSIPACKNILLFRKQVYIFPVPLHKGTLMGLFKRTT
jgi:hypothetical protein